MKMSLVVDGLRSDVVAVGELGDETVADVAERIADVLGRSVPGRVLDLLSDAAAELTASLPEGRVDIRVAGDDVDMTYVEDEPVAAGGERRGLGELIHCAHARARNVEQPEPDRPQREPPARLRHDLKGARTWRR